jgi:predicted membrane protein (TIGR00267 family)
MSDESLTNINIPWHQFLRKEKWHSPKGRAIRDVIFGANDGMVTTLGFVMGVYGAIQDHRIILITGIAELCAGTISMAFGAYLSVKSQQEFFQQQIEKEKQEIEETPEMEKDEVREIYRAKGFEGEELEMVVRRMTQDKKVWLWCMLEEELGLVVETIDNPIRSALITGISFALGALPPLIPYLFFAGRTALVSSVILSIISLFAIGAGKTFLTKKNALKSGLEILSFGLIAALAGYFIGWAVAHFVV